jgi:hypothetical protein
MEKNSDAEMEGQDHNLRTNVRHLESPSVYA